jgi:hypothetical protein
MKEDKERRNNAQKRDSRTHKIINKIQNLEINSLTEDLVHEKSLEKDGAVKI